MSPAPGVADGPTAGQRAVLGAEHGEPPGAGLGGEAAGGGLGPGEQALEGQGVGQRPVLQQGAEEAAAGRVVQASAGHLPGLGQLGQVLFHLCRTKGRK